MDVEERPWWILVGGRRRLGRHVAEQLAASCSLVLTSGDSWADDSQWIKDLASTTQVRTLTWNAEDPLLVPTMMADVASLHADGVRFRSAVVLASDFPLQPFGTWQSEALAALWRINLTFPLLVAQAVVPAMASGGCLQWVLDTCIHQPFLQRLPYCVSRSGLATLVPGLARALAPELRVVGHALGTLLPAEGSDPEALAAGTLLRRLGEPEDLVRALRYASEAQHLTGEILTLDGGARWRRP